MRKAFRITTHEFSGAKTKIYMLERKNNREKWEEIHSELSMKALVEWMEHNDYNVFSTPVYYHMNHE